MSCISLQLNKHSKPKWCETKISNIQKNIFGEHRRHFIPDTLGKSTPAWGPESSEPLWTNCNARVYMTAGARKNLCVYCMCVCKKDRTESKKEELLTCSYSACPTRLLLLLCLVRRFINRTNRGRPDGCYDTVISFHGSLCNSWALACFLLAACWSFPFNTHSCKGEVSHLTHRWYLPILSNYQQLGPPLPW